MPNLVCEILYILNIIKLINKYIKESFIFVCLMFYLNQIVFKNNLKNSGESGVMTNVCEDVLGRSVCMCSMPMV